jgi:hypothetical protein
MRKRTRRKGERKSLEPFPDAQLAMQIPTDEDDERNRTKKRKKRKRRRSKGYELEWSEVCAAGSTEAALNLTGSAHSTNAIWTSRFRLPERVDN